MVTAIDPAGFGETWQIRKPAVVSKQGVVASQHHAASRVGVDVLRAGGNAVDAAVAAGMAIGTVEPWMSGLGGGGNMLVYVASERKTYAVQFGMQAPHGLNVNDYPLVEGADKDLFGWPSVYEDRNVEGPHSMAIPGFVAGMSLALERFGTRPWGETLAPAVALAGEGISVDWYATLKIASGAAGLSRYAESARVYMPQGSVPAGAWGGPPPRIMLGKLGATLRRLAEAGPQDFYTGQIARSIVEDAQRSGSSLSMQDLAQYRADSVVAEAFDYRDARVYVAPTLTGGPTLRHALELLQSLVPQDADAHLRYSAYAQALMQAYQHRLSTLGDVDDSINPSCTTHLSVVDSQGNMVALTQTLLSVFGSKVVLPDSGILMNNGVMWFDPRPGQPNSLQPGRRPLSNMCPTLFEHDGARYALGASGGRRIMPAVFQLLSFVVDCGASVEDAMHTPRIDVSGGSVVSMDARLDERVARAIAQLFDCERAVHGVYPALFACPNIVSRGVDGLDQETHCEGAAFVMSPWAQALAG